MSDKRSKNAIDYISPLNAGPLRGRLLKYPAYHVKYVDQEILFVYGLHSNLERWWGLIKTLGHYGNVTVPDLPGFGGMDSFYKIRQKPTLDNLANYLAEFIQPHYQGKKITIVGLSFGFIVATRMLQLHPELHHQVRLLVSIVGFAHKDDFTFSKTRYYFYLCSARILSKRFSAALFRATALQPWVIRRFYGKTHNAKHKFAMAVGTDETKAIKDAEVDLWRQNDLRTWAFTSAEFLTYDNSKIAVNVPAWHVGARTDNYFDNDRVRQHLRIIFKDFNSETFDAKLHAPSVIASEREADALLPPRLRHTLSKLT